MSEGSQISKINLFVQILTSKVAAKKQLKTYLYRAAREQGQAKCPDMSPYIRSVYLPHMFALIPIEILFHRCIRIGAQSIVHFTAQTQVP